MSIPHSTVAPPAVSISAQNLQRPNPFQASNPEGVAAPLPSHTQEWNSFAPVASAPARQMSSQHSPATPAAQPSHAPVAHTRVNESTTETNAVRLARSTGDAYNAAEAQPQHPEVTPRSPIVTSTDHVPTLSAPPSSQADSTQSILLASEEKGKPLYSMRGLAASIKRSLNAEKLAASMEPSTSSGLHSQPLNSIEAVDTQHQTKTSPPDLAIGKSHDQNPDTKAETQSVKIITDPVNSPSTIAPVSFSEVLIPEEEAIGTSNGLQNPNSQHDSSPNFTPYSTLTGAVSFDDIVDPVLVDHNPAPSSEATGVLEDTTTSQPTSRIVLHDHVDPLIPDQPSFEPLSFPHRTPTPPLAATITIVNDEGETEKAEPTVSRPSTPLHEMEIDLQYIPSGNEDDVEMSSEPGEDRVPIQPNVASSEFSKAWDQDTPFQEADVSTYQATSLDRPIEGIDLGSMVEEHPGNERRRSAQAPEEPPKTSPIRVQSADSVETSSRGSLPELARKSHRKQKFYVAVPPASEWVLQAKKREAERRALMKEKAGEFGYLGIASCYFSCILGQPSNRGS